MTTFEMDGYQDAINGRAYTPPQNPKTDALRLQYQRGYNTGMLYSGRTAAAYSRSLAKANAAGQQTAAAYQAGSSLG